MPADRFIHPRAGHSRKVTMLTDLEFRVWVQYLLSADDFGVMRASAISLQADNDHLANRPQKAVQRCIEALIKAGLVDTFEHQGRRYIFQPTWQEFQKVSYPRGTNNPKPPDDAITRCDSATQELFKEHPGGKGRKNSKRSENVSETDQKHSGVVFETFPTTRAGAPAKRLMANGERLMANGSEGVQGEPLDVWLQEFTAAYPEQGRTSGHLTEVAWVDVLMLDPRGPRDAYKAICDRLEAQKRSHQWRVKGMIPRLDRYLREGLHLQVLPEMPVSTVVSDKTARTLTSAEQFVRGGK